MQKLVVRVLEARRRHRESSEPVSEDEEVAKHERPNLEAVSVKPEGSGRGDGCDRRRAGERDPGDGQTSPRKREPSEGEAGAAEREDRRPASDEPQ